jgi:hypothetical protein
MSAFARRLLAVLLLAGGVTTAFAHPGSGIVVGRHGDVYFVDTGGGVWRIDPRGRLTSLGGPRFHWMAIDQNGRPPGARLPSIAGGEIVAVGAAPTLLVSSDVPIAVAEDGSLFYPEFGADGRLRIFRFTRSGERSVRAVLPSPGGKDVLRWINGLAIGADGTLYYTEDKAVRRIDARGAVTTVAENISVPNCTRIPGNEPEVGPYLRGLAVAADGTLFVAASGCGAVLRITPRGAVTTLLRTISPWSPTAVAASPGGLYVLEYLHTVEEDRQAWIPRVRKVLPNGKVVDVAAVTRPSGR